MCFLMFLEKELNPVGGIGRFCSATWLGEKVQLLEPDREIMVQILALQLKCGFGGFPC